MSEYLVQVELSHKSGFPEDTIVNTFCIDAFPGWDPATELAEITSPIANFYNTADAGFTSLASWLSNGLSRAAAGVAMKIYDVQDHLDGSPHGSPVRTDATTLAAASGVTQLPEECALALTLRAGTWAAQPVEVPDADVPADGRVDRPRQRHTGKLYLGPFVLPAAVVDSGFKTRPNDQLRDALTHAAIRTQAQLSANGHNWCVWSRTDQVFRSIDDVQVDNAWDTQRRRGVASTVRTTVAI